MGLLEQYLGPLWWVDKDAEDWEHFHLRSTEVTAGAIRDVHVMAELEELEGALLMYFMKALGWDYNMLPVPLFPTEPIMRAGWICVKCALKETAA